MIADDGQDAPEAWSCLPAAARHSLELAQASLIAGGLAVGSALAESSGRVVAAGRNRAYDPPGGQDRLQGSPLAHAELNVLAAVPADRELGSDTLWSTQQPCPMCDAALVFTGVGTVCWLAPDPWARANAIDEHRPNGALRRVRPKDDRWIVVANVLFLASVAFSRGPEHPTVTRNAELEPETNALLVELLSPDDARTRLEEPLPVILAGLWDRLRAAARERRVRTAHHCSGAEHRR